MPGLPSTWSIPEIASPSAPLLPELSAASAVTLVLSFTLSAGIVVLPVFSSTIKFASVEVHLPLLLFSTVEVCSTPFSSV